MKINTEYKIGQEVWFFLNEEVRFGTIDKIEVYVTKDKIEVLYQLSSNYGKIEAFETYLFNSKEDLLNSKI